MRNFRELEIWKDSVTLSVEIYSLIKMFPNEEKFGLTSQMSRAAVSIPSNIAEGCRGSNKELKNYLNISLGSSFELETQLEIAHRVGYISIELYKPLMEKIQILQKRINAFRNTVKQTIK